MRQGPRQGSQSPVVTPPTTASDRVFALPDRLSAKDDPDLIGADEAHFAVVADSLERTIALLSDRLDAVRRASGESTTETLERDQEVHRLTARLRTLRRFSLDLCLGRMDFADSPEPVYVGRLGLADADGRRLLVDWRSPAAEPFFGATHANPMGLVSRRRYRWSQRDGRARVTDYWDEVFTAEGLEDRAALDDQSAFIASLGERRTGRMRDVLATIQAEQDAIIRASSRGTLVVDGGPGTGKTVVALHRAAYLQYADPRLGEGRGGILFVGPSRPYLHYVGDVLPSLGEEGVRTCTLGDLVPGGADLPEETDPEVARLKSSAAMVAAIEPAAALYEEPPSEGLEVETPWGDLWLSAEEWAEAFDSPEPGTPHNEGRDVVWESLVSILWDKLEADETEVSPEQFRRALAGNEELTDAFGRAWPLIGPEDLVGDLWSVPAYLRHCAPWLEEREVQALRRADPLAWTTADLPLLDAAHRRLGDLEASRRLRREAASLAAQRQEMSEVINHLIETDDSDLQVMSMLRGDDLRAALVDESGLTPPPTDDLAGPFAHIVVDEAQELTDAEWQMLLARCPSRSFTVVGDRAQARHGFFESWQERLAQVGLHDIDLASLSINYRTPAEVMAEAEPVIRAVLPDANVPTSVRSTGNPVVHGSVDDLARILAEWTAEHAEGIACVIGDPSYVATDRVRSLSPALAKGLEFDLVVLVDPDSFGEGSEGIEGTVDRYVAMTRATQRLVVLTSGQ